MWSFSAMLVRLEGPCNIRCMSCMLHSMSTLIKVRNPGFPPKVWLLQAGVLINFIGNSLVAAAAP